MDLLRAAVADNVEWCELVGGRSADRREGVWTSAGRPPPLFPDAVTLEPGVDPQRLVRLLADRPTCSVKDSFADVDLAPHGFHELLTAHWIAHDPAPVGAAPTGWSCVESPHALADWCIAAGLPEVLPVALLGEPTVRVLAARRDGALVGGAILSGGGTVVGVSNVFGRDEMWPELPSVAAHFVPGRSVVGYEHGADLDSALAAGFDDVGPLRVWLRP